MEKRVVRKEATEVHITTRNDGENKYVVNMPMDRFVNNLLGLKIDEDDIDYGVDIELKRVEVVEYEDVEIGVDD